MIRRLTISTLFIFSVLLLFAQKQYTLTDCYQLAIDKNLSLKRAQNEVKSNVLDRKTAQYSLLPSLYYNIGHYFSFGRNIDPVTNDFVNERFSGGFTSIGLQQRIFSGFSRINAIRQSAYTIKASEYAQKSTELQLLSDITLTYAQVLLSEEQLEIEKSNINRTTKELEIVNEKIKVGRLTKYEHYTFNARLSSELASMVGVQNELSAARQNLRQLLNIPYTDDLSVVPIDTNTLAIIIATEVAAVGLLDTIIQQHPAIKEAQMKEQAARLGVKIAKSNLYPYLAVGGNISSNYNAAQRNNNGGKIPLGTQLSNNLGQNINVSLRVPIFSQMQFANAIKKEKINVSNAQLATDQAANVIVSNTLQLLNDFNGAKQKYTATLSAFEQNMLSYALYEERYRLGQISSVELLTAKDILNSSTSKYVQAKLELYFRFKLLELLKNGNGR